MKMVTKPTRKRIGRPPKKAGPPAPRRPAHRPPWNFWRDPERYLLACCVMMIRKGRSKREAAIIATSAKGVRQLWGLSTKESQDINLERSLERKMLPNGTTRERKMLPGGSVILSIPPAPGKVLIGSGERRFQRKLWRAQRDPAAADWLSAMADQFAIFDAMFRSEPASVLCERLEQIVRIVGPEFELHLRRVHAGVSD
jgi:hypothetical protein